MLRHCVTFVTFAFLSLPALAQDPCLDLQAALDAAPPGSVVDGRGVFFGFAGDTCSITIRKPVTLLGGQFGGTNRAPIVLDGPGHGSVTLIGVTTERTGSCDLAVVRPGIEGGGFDVLHVVESSVRAQSFNVYGYEAVGCFDGSDAGFGSPGIRVSVPTVIVENSFVEGSLTGSGGFYYAVPCAGIETDGLVVLIRSEVHGGNAGEYYLPDWYVCSPQVRRPFQVPGGPAVLCAEFEEIGSKLYGGRGAYWQILFPPSGRCYQSPDGEQVVTTTALMSGPRSRRR